MQVSAMLIELAVRAPAISSLILIKGVIVKLFVFTGTANAINGIKETERTCRLPAGYIERFIFRAFFIVCRTVNWPPRELSRYDQQPR
jgi:hypothetical protein